MTDQLTHDELTRDCQMSAGLLETTGHVDLTGTERVPGPRLHPLLVRPGRRVMSRAA